MRGNRQGYTCAMSSRVRVAGFASSLRTGSLNRRLLDRAMAALAETGDVDLDCIDLALHPLPLYDADLQEREGIPAPAQDLHDRFAAADALLVVNPEYNGGYPALFKNMVDWVSRIDMFVFHPLYVGLLSGTPGKGGGVRGIEHTRALFSNIFVTTHPDGFALPRADEELDGDHWTRSEAAVRLERWAGEFVGAAADHVEERRDAA